MPSSSTRPPGAVRAALLALAILPAVGVLAVTGDTVAAAVALALGPLAAGAGWSLAHRTIRARLERLADAADGIAAGDATAREGLRRGGHGRLGRALDALAASHEALTARALLVDAAPAGIVAVDTGGRVTHANPAATALLRTTLPALHGAPIHAAVHALHAAHGAAVCPLLDAAHDGRAHAGTDVFTAAVGPPRDVDWAAAPIVAGGAVRGVAIAFNEVTDQRRFERRVREAERNEAVSRLADGVAHEFNNLLAVVLATAKALAHDLPEGDLREDAEEIAHAAQRGAALVQKLRGAARRPPSEPRAIDLAAALAALSAPLRDALGPGHALAVEIRGTAGPVRADPAQLEEALRALVLGARDRMPHGGKVTVTLSATAELPGGRWTTLEVRDEGAGLPEEAQARLFEPFSPAGAAASSAPDGLAAVLAPMRQAGGEVVVDSDPARGTAVTLFLPGASDRAPQLELVAWEGDAALRGEGTVLVLDDDAAAVELARATLASLGYQVLSAASAAEAEAVVREHRGAVDAAVVSAVLSRGGAAEQVARLRARFPRIEVLLVAEGEDHPAVARAGAPPGNVLARPLAPLALAERLATVLRRRR